MPDKSTSILRTYRFGAKNKKVTDPAGVDQPTAYPIHADYSLPLATLLETYGVDLAPDTAPLITPENFPSPGGAGKQIEVELFDFSFRADYGRLGVDEAFIRDKLDMLKYRPATLPELICFDYYFRETYQGQWHEARTVIALGSVHATTQIIRKKGWLRKAIVSTRRHYPELQVVSGRPRDLLTLSTTELDRDGNWPNETLFLAVATG
jgi:hypothetical protein